MEENRNIQQESKDIKADIWGLQIENRRMLAEIRGRREDEQT